MYCFQITLCNLKIVDFVHRLNNLKYILSSSSFFILSVSNIWANIVVYYEKIGNICILWISSGHKIEAAQARVGKTSVNKLMAEA